MTLSTRIRDGFLEIARDIKTLSSNLSSKPSASDLSLAFSAAINRGNHTGTQSVSTIDNLNTALAYLEDGTYPRFLTEVDDLPGISDNSRLLFLHSDEGDNQYIKTYNLSEVKDYVRDGLTSDNVHELNKLLVYYGNPIAYKGLWNIHLVIPEISKFKYWVVGDTYGDPTHEEFASTSAIIAGVRANGVKVYGYVPIGLNTSALTLTQMQTKVDQWDNLGVDGIFLDEFGFDYGNTRQRQIDIVNYVHSKGLPYCANARTVHDFACDDINELPWAGVS